MFDGYPVKATTGLAGLPVQKHGREILIKLYEKMLEEIKVIEKDSPFRVHVERLTRNNMKILKSTKNIYQAEKDIGMGQVEELILMAEDEMKHVIPLMAKDKPWKSPKWHKPFFIWSDIYQ